MVLNLQDIGADTQAPHITGERDRVKVDDLWGTVFWRRERQPDTTFCVHLLSESKVYDLDVTAF